jgi:hypothetical protein
VGTVALSLGASFGMSVLVWQHLQGVELYWVILPLAVILLLAVGSDYNLLLVSRFQGGDPCRHQHRHHPVDGGQRIGGDRGRLGVRVHHGVVHLQRPAPVPSTTRWRSWGRDMDSRFSFLSTAHADLLNEILARRSSTLLERIRQADSVSRSDAEEIMSVISDEVTDNLDDWEPTDYGQAVSAVLAQFNGARANEWP